MMRRELIPLARRKVMNGRPITEVTALRVVRRMYAASPIASVSTGKIM